MAGCKEGLPNAGSLRNVSIKYVYYQSGRWDFWMNSAQHMSPDQNHARAQIDASRGALALARALPPLLCRQGISHLSGRLVRQLAGSSRYPKRMKGPAIAGGYLFDERSEEHTSELQSLMRSSYAVFCLKKKTKKNKQKTKYTTTTNAQLLYSMKA